MADSVKTDKENREFGWAIFLAVTTVGFFALAVWFMSGPTVKPTFKVAWESGKAKLNVEEKPPVEFWHDEENDQLLYRGKITNDDRVLLLKLKFDDITGDEQIAYRQSIGKLTYLSNVPEEPLVFLMLIAAFGGIIGVQARSVSYFILHACVKHDLNLQRWWAWYWLRPLLGMVFGPLVVLLIMTGLLPRPDTPQADTLTMFVLSILVGMVASMFFDKLVQLAQTLFGLNSDDAPQQMADERAPTAVEAQAAWDPKASTAEVSWTASTNPNLDRYEVRVSAGATYDANKHVVLPKLAPGALKCSTADHPAAAGDTATFKVFVILKNGKEAGSEPISITRPPAPAG